MGSYTLVQDETYKTTTIARDGKADFYLPDDGFTIGLIAVHGGSWSFGSKTDMYGLGDFYAQQGYMVAACNYHLQGNGESPGAHLPRSYEDVRDFILWCQAHEEATTVTRWMLIGHSAGAQIGFAIHANGDAPLDGVINLDSGSWDWPAMNDVYLDAYIRPYFTEAQLSSESANVIMRANGNTTQSKSLAFIAAGVLEDQFAAQAQEYVDSYSNGDHGEVIKTSYEHTELLYKAYEPGNAVANRILEFLPLGVRTYSAWSAETSFRTKEEDFIPPVDPPVDPSNLAPTRYPLTIINPKKSNLASHNRYSYAHSQMDYIVPIGIIGGRPPFRFAISGVPGATVRGLAPHWNPKMASAGEVTLPAGAFGTWQVTVTDYDNNTDSVSVTVGVEDSKFIFVSPSGNDGNSGTISSPKKTFAHVWGDQTGTGVTPYMDNIIVMRGGDYTMPGAEGGAYVQIHTRKPKSVIGFPGERPKLIGNKSVHGGFFNNIGSTGPYELKYIYEMFWSNITLNGGTPGGGDQQASWFKFRWRTSHHVWYQIRMEHTDTLELGTSDNWGGIIYENSASGGNVDISLIDIEAHDLRGYERTNLAAIEFYTTARANVDIFYDTGSSLSHGVYAKSTNQHIFLTSISSWSDTYCARGPCYNPNGKTYTFPLGDVTAQTSVQQIRYCRFFKLPNDNGQGEDDMDGCVLINGTDNEGYGNTYLDRSTGVMWTSPHGEVNPDATANIAKSVIINNKGWTTWHIAPHYSLSQVTTGYFKDDQWKNLIDDEGRLLSSTGLRYKIGYEV